MKVFAVLATLLLAPLAANADTASSNLQVRAVVKDTCLVGAIASSSQMAVSCSKATPVSVTIGADISQGSFQSDALTLSPPHAFVATNNAKIVDFAALKGQATPVVVTVAY